LSSCINRNSNYCQRHASLYSSS